MHGLQQRHHGSCREVIAFKLLAFLCDKGGIGSIIIRTGFYFFGKFNFDREIIKEIVVLVYQQIVIFARGHQHQFNRYRYDGLRTHKTATCAATAG